jgi:endonuclease YncB( thermonuclease family)
MKNFIKLSFLLLFIMCLISSYQVFSQDGVTQAAPRYERNKPKEDIYSDILVTKVIDADTLELENGEEVRLLGIAALGLDNSYGQEAKEFIKALIEGKRAKLVFDNEKFDKDGKLLAYVYIYNPDYSKLPSSITANDLVGSMWEGVGGLLVYLNATVIKTGYAQPMTVYPNVRETDLFRKLYKGAKENKRGLWSKDINLTEASNCKFDSDCFGLDCNKYDNEVKSGYNPSCVENKCKCMCYGCE